MSKKTNYAVITGDIINFSDIEGEEKNHLNASLKGVFDEIKKRCADKEFSPSFNIFRGDSFQGVLANIEDALRAGLLIRTSLRKNNTDGKKTDWDARIAIGIGSIAYLPENISEGDGPAYRNSGPVLDALQGDIKCAITVPSQHLNDEFKASCALLDAVINKWTPPQAEIIYMLLQDKTQKSIGEELGISQAAVHYRVKAAGWFAVKEFLMRFETLMQQY